MHAPTHLVARNVARIVARNSYCPTVHGRAGRAGRHHSRSIADHMDHIDHDRSGAGAPVVPPEPAECAIVRSTVAVATAGSYRAAAGMPCRRRYRRKRPEIYLEASEGRVDRLVRAGLQLLNQHGHPLSWKAGAWPTRYAVDAASGRGYGVDLIACV